VVEETDLRQLGAVWLKCQLAVDDDANIFDGVQTSERRQDSSQLAALGHAWPASAKNCTRGTVSFFDRVTIC